MSLALEEAAKAKGSTAPNPMVGAILVREGEIMARGYHRRAGMPHAEVEALAKLNGSAEGMTMYVNLEPCSHYGRTPPCVDRLIEAKVARVVVGIRDPNPRVNGEGLARLRAAGIEVTTGVLAEACTKLNAPFLVYIQQKRPLVQLKIAMSLDARIATRTGDSRWLSSPDALRWAHQQRAEADAILVGAGTLIADDPSLTTRLVKGRDPLRVVLDSQLRAPLSSKIYQAPLAAGTIVCCTQAASEERRAALEAQGVRVFVVAAQEDCRCSLRDTLELLHKLECLHLLVEGGGAIHGAFLQAGLVDRLSLVLTPWLLGATARPAFDFVGADRLVDALHLEKMHTSTLGVDILLEASSPLTMKPDVAPLRPHTSTPHQGEVAKEKKDE